MQLRKDAEPTDTGRAEFTRRLAEREGLTRAFGPRPAGDACASSKIAFGDFVEPPFPYLGSESPLRCRRGRQIQTEQNLRAAWRRGRDYSALRASPLRGRPDGRYPRVVAITVI